MSAPMHNLLPKVEDMITAYVKTNAEIWSDVNVYGSMEVITGESSSGRGLKVPWVTCICDTATPMVDDVDAPEVNMEDIILKIEIITRSRDDSINVITCRQNHNDLVGKIKGLFRHSDIVTLLNAVGIEGVAIIRMSRPRQSFGPMDNLYRTQLEYNLTAYAVET